MNVKVSSEATAVKYTDSIEIALPREETVRLLSDPTQLRMWFRGLVRHEPVSGAYGEIGTVSRVVLRTGKQELEGTETITRREPADLVGIPGEVEVVFERELVADGLQNVTRDRLLEMNPRRTRWESDNEYHFDRALMRLLSPVMRGSLQKQSRRRMQDFKAFAESGTDVRRVDG